MGGSRQDDVAARRPPATLIAGFVLAVLATLAIFFTDNPTYLRLAVIVAGGAFLLAATAAVAAARRRPDQAALAAREAELRRAFEYELDREEAAHREIELQLESDVRREAQESVRYELDALRREIVALSSMRGDVRGISVLRDQLAALPALRDELAAISALRAEVAAMNALRDEVEALAELRDEFGQLGELRAEVSRLRTELTEQLSGELLVERIVMRTQGRWNDAERPPGSTEEEPLYERYEPDQPGELTAGWPGVGLDDHLGSTRDRHRVRAEPPTSALDYLAPSSRPADRDDDGGSPPTAEVLAITADRPRPQPFPRYDRPLPPNDYARRPASGSDDAVTDPLLRSTRRPAPPAPVLHEPAPTGPVYVSEILAEQGTPPPSGRRHRRYRDEDTEDDVLSRVLKRN